MEQVKEEPLKYRIEEKNGIYSIQVRGYKYKGILWWRKKVWEWCECDISGGVLNYHPLLLIPSAPYFNNIENAKEWVS